MRRQILVRVGDHLIYISGLNLAVGHAHTLIKGEPLREYTLRGFDGTAFVEVLGLISQLPGLESLVLNFRAHDGPFRFDTDTNDNDREFPAEIILQFLIFRALAENSQRYPSPLKSLTIDKLLPLPHPYISSPTIIALLSTLSHLSIKTTTQCAAFPMTDPRLEWTSTPLFEKGAFSTSLASLELHHASVRSADVLVSLSEIQLPRLETLSLQRIYFSDKGKPEDFIARHGGTLLKLKLFLCPMALSTSGSKGSEGRPASFRRWTQVWERLRSDLKNLRGLVVSERHDSNGVDDAGLGRYVDNCYSCNAVDLGEAETAEDDIAFELFQKSVVLRSHDV